MFERLEISQETVREQREAEPDSARAVPWPALASRKERRQLSEIIDLRIAQIRRDKESAVDAEDYERAAALRAAERQLIAQKASRQQGIDLQDGAA
jgi:UvrB/uvrC motif